MSSKENREIILIDVSILINIHNIAKLSYELRIFEGLKEGFFKEAEKLLWGYLCRVIFLTKL